MPSWNDWFSAVAHSKAILQREINVGDYGNNYNRYEPLIRLYEVKYWYTYMYNMKTNEQVCIQYITL